MSDWVTLPGGARINLDHVVHISPRYQKEGSPHIDRLDLTVPTGLEPEAPRYLGEIELEGADAVALDALLGRRLGRPIVAPDGYEEGVARRKREREAAKPTPEPPDSPF